MGRSTVLLAPELLEELLCLRAAGVRVVGATWESQHADYPIIRLTISGTPVPDGPEVSVVVNGATTTPPTVRFSPIPRTETFG